MHTGLDWIHSLLDGHSEILIMPALSFYRCCIKLNLKSEKNNEIVYKNLYDYISKYVGPDCKNEQKNFLTLLKKWIISFLNLNKS